MHLTTMYLPGLLVVLLNFPSNVSTQQITRHVSAMGRLDHVVLDHLGHVFVGGSNVILQFENEGLTPSDQINMMFTACGHPSNTPGTCSANVEPNNVSVFYLYKHNRIEETNAALMVCGTVSLGQCFIFDVKNISRFWPIVSPDVDIPAQARLGSKTSAAVVQAHGDYLFSAISTTGMRSSTPIYTFSERNYHSIPNGARTMYYKDQDDPDMSYITSKPDTHFTFIKGFLYNNFVYFLRNTHTNHLSEAYISQTCIHDYYFRSYIEARLRCGAFVIAETATIFNITDKTYLLVAFTSKLHPGSSLCIYDVGKLEERFNVFQMDCFKHKLGSWPGWLNEYGNSCDQVINRTKIECGWTESNRRILAHQAIEPEARTDGEQRNQPLFITSNDIEMTSLAFMEAGEMAIGYIGHSDGTLVKLLLNVGLNKYHVLYRANITENQPVDPNMVLNEAGDKLFYTYTNTVASLKADDCSLLPNCRACLADIWSCVWTDTCHAGNNVTNDTIVYSTNCPPEIYKVSPLTGPVEGGTLVNIQGDLGRPRSNVMLRVGTATNNITFKYSSMEIFRINTTAVTPGTKETQIEVTVTPENLNKENPWDVVTSGTTRYRHNFQFLTPKLLAVNVTTFAIKSGNVSIQLRGEHMDIGSHREVIVGQKPCKHVSVFDNIMSCMAPPQSTTGPYAVVLHIDNARVSGPSLTYIPDPIIRYVEPNTTIESGGIPLTIEGKNLHGLGLGVYLTLGPSGTIHETTPPCKVHVDMLVCLTPPFTGFGPSPINVSLGLGNQYGMLSDALIFYEQKLGKLMILKDPDIEEERTPMHFDLRKTSTFRIRGQRLNHVGENNIRVLVGNRSCAVTKKTDLFLTCEVNFGSHTNDTTIYEIWVYIGTNLKFKAGKVFRGVPERLQYSFEKVPSSNRLFIGFGIGISAIFVIFVTALFILRMHKKLRRQRRTPYNVIFQRGRHGEAADMLGSEVSTPQTVQNAYQPMFRQQEPAGAECKDKTPLLSDIDPDLKQSLDQQGLLISPDMLVLGENIGRGNFGSVFKGYLHKLGQKGETVVAAKTLHRGDLTDINVERFLKEALIMKDFRHNNVMELIGICVDMETLPLVILPFMTRGDVLTYIRDVNNVPTVKRLVEFGIDIANGMYYLSQLKFIHRDLAARNCMIDKDLTVKVADFGLSRDVYEKEYYTSCDKKSMLPVKWMSPESLEFGLFSYKTDIWSYGVVLWELLTRGMNPYPAVDNWDVLRYLKTGRRLSKPDYCPEGIYRIMMHCWAWEPNDRPSFGDIIVKIPHLLERLDRMSRSSSTEESK